VFDCNVTCIREDISLMITSCESKLVAECIIIFWSCFNGRSVYLFFVFQHNRLVYVSKSHGNFKNLKTLTFLAR